MQPDHITASPLTDVMDPARARAMQATLGGVPDIEAGTLPAMARPRQHMSQTSSPRDSVCSRE